MTNSARAVAHQRGLFDFGADHDAGRVGEGEHGDVERLAELHEARGLVGAVAIDRAGQMHGVVGDHADRPAFDADEAR